MKKDRKLRLERLNRRRRERSGGRCAEGKLSASAAGFGFVRPEDGGEDIFIPPPFMNGALDGDMVKVKLLPERREDGRGPAGRIEEILERGRSELVGELLAGRIVRPLDRRLPDEVEITGPLRGARRGDWVRVGLLEPEHGRMRGVIRQHYGKAGAISADLDAVAAEFGLERPYTDEECAEAAAAEPRGIERADCTGLMTVTIDPFDAKDFDDALSIRDCGDTAELGVHISDVAAFIAPRGKFDAAAAKRGFSCYLPGRTLPMLPRTLTASISMRAGERSRAHSVFLTVEKATGKVISAVRKHTWVKVDHRLNYDEVQEFAGTEFKTAPAEWSAEMRGTLEQLLKLTRKMREYRRSAEHFLDMDLPEIRVICDEEQNRILGLSRRTQRESELLVEECMLAANSAVGEEMLEKNIPGIYRVHPAPEGEKITEFSAMLDEVFGMLPGDLTVRDNCNRFIAALPADDPKREIILNLFLRALPRAFYQCGPGLHFGLGKSRYAHFTSPIRRYTDLTVHQQLWNADCGTRLKNAAGMAKTALRCSELEENSDNAGFAASDRLKLRYLQERLDAGGENLYEAVVVKVFAAGIQIDIREMGLYGFVPRESLTGRPRRQGAKFKKQRGGEYKPGDFIYVRLDGLDTARGQARFAPAGF